VALNLVSNAIKFTQRGEVSIELTSSGQTTTVRVRDSGLGVPPGEQAAIFEEFRRSARSVEAGYGGLGLGLAISKRLVELHGGAMGVESTGEEGAGSAFFFTLPVMDSHAAPVFVLATSPRELAYFTEPVEPLPANEDAPKLARNILVVDDDPDTLALHARLAQSRSASGRVFAARNGLDALRILAEESVDLVLLDLTMPEMDGFAVLEAMRGRPATRSIPVVVVTGQNLSEADMARLNLGVTRVLNKGVFSVEETLSHLDAALARRRDLSSEAQRLVRQAVAFMHAHYAEPLTREQVAVHVGLNADYLTSSFRRELGLTPIAYLNRYRVEQARRLLRDTDKSITEIALAVGFSGSSYFSRIFHRETGESPAAYRRSG
jgi:AraC-like DNA-binding protein